jgi:ACR3 family arsenite efflux pump ArsB
METVVTLLMMFVVGPAVFIALYWLLFNNENGERYLKYRTQGPFTPLPKDKTKK